jgi:hypothetical protein
MKKKSWQFSWQELLNLKWLFSRDGGKARFSKAM